MVRLVSLGLVVSLAGLAGCDIWTQESDDPVDLPSNSESPVSPTAPDSADDPSAGLGSDPEETSENPDDSDQPNSARQRPEFSSEKIEIEGQPTELALKLFTEPELPYSTYVPINEFVTDIQETDQATVVTHYVNFGGTLNENAYMRIVLPKRPTTVEALQEQILGEEGLMASQNWQITDRTDVVVWPDRKSVV